MPAMLLACSATRFARCGYFFLYILDVLWSVCVTTVTFAKWLNQSRCCSGGGWIRLMWAQETMYYLAAWLLPWEGTL